MSLFFLYQLGSLGFILRVTMVGENKRGKLSISS